MRGYMELVDFMKSLGDGILDYLPENQRHGQLTVEEIVQGWMKGKSYFAAVSLKKDMVSYIKLHNAGDYSVDEILFWYDLCFIFERFGVDEHVFFAAILHLIDAHIELKKKALFVKYFGWASYR